MPASEKQACFTMRVLDRLTTCPPVGFIDKPQCASDLGMPARDAFYMIHSARNLDDEWGKIKKKVRLNECPPVELQ